MRVPGHPGISRTRTGRWRDTRFRRYAGGLPAPAPACCNPRIRVSRPHMPPIWTTASPQGRPAARHRPRPLQRRRQPARPGLCLRAALAARPRPHPLDRHRGGARHAGRAGRADRRGRRRPTGSADVPHTPIPMKPPADILLINRDGSAHGYRAAGAAADRPGALRRPAGGDGGGRNARAGQGRGRARRRGLRRCSSRSP